MSFLAIPAVPYIITGSMSLYLSYKTYSSYCQNVEFIELERDNKIKNDEELEQNMKSKKENEVNFVSIDEDNNISVEKIESETENQSTNRPATPYPHEEIEGNTNISMQPSLESPKEEIVQEIVSDVINRAVEEVAHKSQPPPPPPPSPTPPSPTPPSPPELTTPTITELPENNKKTNNEKANNEKAKKKRKRKRKKHGK